jgi:hypothetical protein
VSQRWAVRQHSCKPRILSLHCTTRQLERGDAARAVTG